MRVRWFIFYGTLMVLGYFSAQFWLTHRWSVAVPMTLAALVVIALRNTIAPKTPEKKL